MVRPPVVLVIAFPCAGAHLNRDTDKTIKLWKVFEKSLKVVAENNMSSASFNNQSAISLSSQSSSAPDSGNNAPSAGTGTLLPPTSPPGGTTSGSGAGASARNGAQQQIIPSLKLPRMSYHDNIVAAVPRKVYANAHAYHINSISINSDQETYLSADDLRINLWNLAISDQSFSACHLPCPERTTESLTRGWFSDILDIKPVNMEELTEVITAAEFHPTSCNLFCYSSSKGTVKLADMREQALCDRHSKGACICARGREPC